MNKHTDRVRKLFALHKSEKNEAAALAALEKAMEYAARHGVSLEDIANHTEESEKVTASKDFSVGGDKHIHPIDRFMLKAIADFCGVVLRRPFLDPIVNIQVSSFVGHEASVELAYWLRFTIRDVADELWSWYRLMNCQNYSETQMFNAREDYFKGMATRLRQRMAELQIKHPIVETPTSNALIVKKYEIIHNYMKDQGMSPADYVTGRGPRSMKHAGAGYTAGNAVGLGRGVGQGGAKQIGVRR